MEACTSERRRQISKTVLDDSKLSRQRRFIQIRKLKKEKAPTERRARATAVVSADICKLEEDHGLKSVVQTLMWLPEDSISAQVDLNSLCDHRPYEMIKSGVLPILVEGLKSEPEFVKERATWCLAKLVAIDVGIRDAILQDVGAMAALKQNIEGRNVLSFGLSCLQLMTGLLNHKAMPPNVIILEWQDFLTFLITNVMPENPHMDVVIHASLAISFISMYPGINFDTRIVQKLVTFLGHSEERLVDPALLALGYTVARSTTSIQVALDAGVLHHIKKLLKDARTQVSTCFLLAGIAAGTPQQLQMLFKPSFLPVFKQVADLACGDFHFDVKSHALQVIVTVIKNGRDGHVIWMDELRGVPAVCEALHFTNDVNILKPVLEALTIVLDVCASIHFNYRPRMARRGVEEKLAELEGHPSPIISNMCTFLLDKYFNNAEDDDSYFFDDVDDDAPASAAPVNTEEDESFEADEDEDEPRENVAPVNAKDDESFDFDCDEPQENVAPVSHAARPKENQSACPDAPRSESTFGNVLNGSINTQSLN